MNTHPHQKTALLVLGMHRSGTSALTRTVSLLGGQLPKKLMAASQNNNAEGFWEPQDVYEHNEYLLKTFGSQWDDWRPLSSSAQATTDLQEYTETQSRILQDNYPDATFIVLKDPRMCRLYPLWESAFTQNQFEPAALIALRHPLEVADSLQARDRFSTNRSLLLWLRHMLDAELYSRAIPRCVVPFAALLTDWKAEVTRAETQLQVHWPRRPDDIAKEVETFLNRGSRHHAHLAAEIDTHPAVFAWVRQAYAAFQSLVADPRDTGAQDQLDRVREAFDNGCRIFGPEWFAAESAEKASRHARDVAEYQQRKLEEKAAGLDARLQRTEAARSKDREQIQQLNTHLAEHKNQLREAKQSLATTSQALTATRGELRHTRDELKSTRKSLQTRERQLIASWRFHQQMEAIAAGAATHTLDLMSAATGRSHAAFGYRLRTWKFIAKRSTLTRRQLRTLVASRLFNADHYRALNPDVATSGIDPLLHWLQDGWAQGRSPSLWFDLSYYLARYPDVAESQVNPLLHYLDYGWRERRTPHPLFDPEWYLRHAPDVAAAERDPLSHYAQSGHRENRSPSPWFDAHWYAQRHGIPQDVAFVHFSLLSRQFPVAPTPFFDVHWYASQNSDVIEDGATAFAHFIQHGAAEGRSPNPWFDSRWYVARYPESAGNPLLHYLQRPDRRHTDPGPEFSCAAYRSRYADVAGSGMDAYTHFMTLGRYEDRDPRPSPTPKGRVSAASSAVRKQHSRASVAQPLTPARIAQAQALVTNQSPPKRFSVVLPTWNRLDTLPRSVQSVLDQSYPHWELIICDDGSDDGSEALIEAQFGDAIRSGKIRYLSLPHAGVCAARNAGLAAAEGDWIAYLDSDNSWHPDYLLLTAQAFLRNPARTHYAGLRVRDEAQQTEFERCVTFDWPELLRQNYIDLNIFAHHRAVYAQLGGFDEELTRLVDWDLILRYTRTYPPAFTPHLLADYFLAHALNNITHREPLERNEQLVRRKYAHSPREGEHALKLAYVLWDWPALSQTFVLEELHELKRRGIDVVVYFHTAPDKAATQVPELPAYSVIDAEDLAAKLRADQRNWIHSHFAYPAVTKLVWPAAERAGIPFSFMPHAVDIFHHSNRERNQIAAVTQSPYCARVMVHGQFHRDFLAAAGVPSDKFSFTPQALDLAPLLAQCAPSQRDPAHPLRIVVLARLIEKKGLHYLIEAVAKMSSAAEVNIFGYGPLQETLQAQIETLGLQDRIQFRGGYEGPDALARILNAADVCCLPCIEAENGDLDGMPTVLFEAMAACVPVVSTTVAAIPEFITHGINGYLVPPRDSQALAECLDQLATLPAEQLLALAQHARKTVQTQVGTSKTVDTLLDTACRPPLDIFMVTFHRENYGNWPATERAIRSVLTHTTTPFTLTIVDNASDHAFLEQLQALAANDERIRILPLAENIYCGPASNLALELAQSEFAIYVCSNEGLILKRGWERTVIATMREHPKAALGGQRAYSPRWFDGKTYAAQPWISSFRNPEFATRSPDREFWHIQGGLFAIRMDVFKQHGGFSPERPQDLMDVELSFYYESLGFELIDIPGIVALSNKTRPTIEALVDESTIAVHPVFAHELPLLELCQSARGRRCNLCGWLDPSPSDNTSGQSEFTCPQCGSSSADRSIFKALAESNLHHRSLPLGECHLGEKAKQTLGTMFALTADTGVRPSPRIAALQKPSSVLGIPPQVSTS